MVDVPSRIAVVTGASSGIGRAAAIALNDAGWTVVLSGRRGDALAETVKLMSEETRHKTLVVPGDLAKSNDVVQLFRAVRSTYGRLDLLFNTWDGNVTLKRNSQNAGMPSPKVPLEDLPLEAFQQVMGINVTAVFQCCQEAIKIMKLSKIINNGSVSAYAPRPLSAPYTMSKHAIWGLTKTIAIDYRQCNIACSQLDLGNTESVMSSFKTKGILQANGSITTEPVIDAKYAGRAVVCMASLPLEVNILNQTLMPSNQPFVGRG